MKYELFENTRETTEVSETIEKLEEGVFRELLGQRVEATGEQEEKETVFGNPEKDSENWHHQSEFNSCAVVCQEYIAEQLLGKDFSESKMIEFAERNGWYNSEEGTTLSDVGNLLEAVGLDVERVYGAGMNDLAQSLASGEKIICGVSKLVLEDPYFAEFPGVLADHAVEVIGIDTSDADHPEVILNDPGSDDGKGIRYDLDAFEKAWKTSNHFAVFVDKKGD